MAGTLTVQNLQGPSSGANANKVIIPSGQTIDASAGTLVPSAGQVVQFVQNFVTGNRNTTSTTYVAVGLGVTITPKYATSKLLVAVHGGRIYAQNAQQIDFKLYEGTSAVDSNRLGSVYQNGGSGSNVYYNGLDYMAYLDASSTTSRTYNLYYKTSSGTGWFTDAGDIQTFMTVTEVKQ